MFLLKFISVIFISIFLTSCSDNKSKPKKEASHELNLDNFKDYCMLTLKQDYELKSSFDDPLLKAKTGDRFLITDLPKDSSETMYEIMTPDLKYSDVAIDSSEVKLEADCNETNTFSYLVALRDFNFYADKDLKTKPCEVKKGLMHEGRIFGGPSPVIGDGEINLENQLYEVNYDGYQCGGQSTLFYAETGNQGLPFQTLYSKKWMESGHRKKLDLNSAAYNGYCKITLEQDYNFIGFFDKPAFGGKSGESFLVTSDSGFGTKVLDSFGKDKGEIDSSKAKFKSNCEQYEESSLVAIGEVEIYSDQELKNKLCILNEGDVLNINKTRDTTNGSYAEGLTYEISFDGKVCGHENSIYLDYKYRNNIVSLYKKP